MERAQLTSRERERELTDRILSMKGYREFGIIAAPPPLMEPIETEQNTIEWAERSEHESEGFRPY